MTGQSPAAKPSVENCKYCQVRHLCDDSWAQVVPHISAVCVGDRFDYHGLVASANGAHSWTMKRGPGEPTVLLRTSSPSTSWLGTTSGYSACDATKTQSQASSWRRS